MQIGISLLVQPGIIIHLDAGFIDGPSPEQFTVNTKDMQDVEDKDMITCERNSTSIFNRLDYLYIIQHLWKTTCREICFRVTRIWIFF